MSTMDDEFLSTQEVEKLLRIHRVTIIKYAKAGVIPGGKIGGQWRFRRSQIMAMFPAVKEHKEEQG